MTDQEYSEVNAFYKGKSIFVTGGSGFMGKVLIEKLLYSCPDLKEIFFLIRPKKGRVPESRLQEMIKLPMFQRIRDEKPEVLKKLIPIQGDVTFDGLGLSSGPLLDRVLQSTSFVFHLAATLRLEANLKDAIQMNTTGTKRIIDLCYQMPNLKLLLHLSTAFCYCDKEMLQEKVFDCPHDPHDLMRCAEWMDVKTLDNITPNLLHPHPNTYTYSKRLAEMLIRDEHDKLPVAIARPSIVTPAFAEPLPGWVDNLNGPVGIMIGAGKGVIRSMLCNGDYKAEVIPVDFAINGLITIPYVEAKREGKAHDIPVYNLTVSPKKKVTWREVMDQGKEAAYANPFEAGVWYPNGTITTNKIEHLFKVVFFQWVPAYLIDFLMLVMGQKRFMIRIQNKIADGLDVLQFFTMRQWDFKEENYRGIANYLIGKDIQTFTVDTDTPDNVKYLVTSVLGGRQYCLKEPLSTLPKARMQLKALYVLDRATKLVLVLFLGWTLMKWTGINTLLIGMWSTPAVSV